MGYRTLAVKPETYDRFEAYKFKSMTADNVLNWLMDRVPLEDAFQEFAAEHFAKHGRPRRRARTRAKR